jgi:hypothetical protein
MMISTSASGMDPRFGVMRDPRLGQSSPRPFFNARAPPELGQCLAAHRQFTPRSRELTLPAPNNSVGGAPESSFALRGFQRSKVSIHV